MEPSDKEIENEFYRELKYRRQCEQEEEKKVRKSGEGSREAYRSQKISSEPANERNFRLEHIAGDISSMPYIESQSLGSD